MLEDYKYEYQPSSYILQEAEAVCSLTALCERDSLALNDKL